MVLLPGARLGPYEIVAPIGAGGMGEVYQATDTRLGRTVAIKVLPAPLASDPEFKARFEREARSISAFNHPHICTLHDVGEADTAEAGPVSYLVMEFLQGETLAARLARGALPLDAALEYACQIADALDRAHRQGIVHRDLKPANVFLTRSGAGTSDVTCKLLDFGLAKLAATAAAGSLETHLASSGQDGNSPLRGTVEGAPLTAQGTILGTFQYMAPEQIEGQEADARSDIWAFGCVLYEMVTGRRAFQGRSQASLVASILERQPAPLAELQPTTPPGLDRVVRTCLAKDPDHRFHAAHDLRLHLQWIREGGSAAGVAAPVVSGRRRRRRVAAGGVALAVATLAFAAGWWTRPPPPVDVVVTRFALPLPQGQGFTRRGRHTVTISPDGSKIAYIANQQIYLRDLRHLEPQPIRGTQMDPAELAFSPDGESIAFVAPAEVGGGSLLRASLVKIRTAGGTPVTLCTVGAPFGIRWQGERIVFSTGADIKAVAEAGGEPETLLSVNAESGETLAQPQLVGNGKVLLYTVRARDASFSDADIAVQPIGGTRRVLVAGGMDGRALAEGVLLYVRNNIIFGQAFDASALTLAGGPVPLLENVSVAPVSGGGQFAISETGTLVFIPGSGSRAGELVWVDRKGTEQALAAPVKNYSHPRISPDGARIAMAAADGDRDIWIWDDARQIVSRLTSGPARDLAPVWSHDGRWIIYQSDAEGQIDLFRRAADSTGTTERLTNTPETEGGTTLLPEATRLLVRIAQAGRDEGRGVLSIVTLGGNTAAEPVIPTAGLSQLLGEVSPDGRWLAYEARESASRGEIYVRPFPKADTGRWQVSVAGGTRPVWSRTGRELFFVTERPSARMMVVSVQPSAPGEPFSYSTPATVFEVSDRVKLGQVDRGFDVSPDGTRFLMLRGEEADDPMQLSQPSMTVVTGWADEMKAQLAER